MSSRWCESQAVRLKRAGLPDGEASSVRNYGAGDHRPPSQSSKTVLSTVHVGGPERTELSLSQKWKLRIGGADRGQRVR